MRRYVAMLTAVLLLAVAASGQGRPRKAAPAVMSGPANYGPAHGACGPDQPFIQKVIPPPIGDPVPGGMHGVSVAGLTGRRDLVLLGRPTGFSAAPGRYGGIETTATFAYPMVLKSPADGPRSGVKSVQVNFVGGTALMDGVCTEDLAGSAWQAQMHAGGLYLVFAGLDKSDRRFWGGPVYAIDEKTAHIISPATYARLRKGTPDSLVPAIRAINAEVARERRAAQARSGGQQ